MPSIILTHRCNLHCPYCFAHDSAGGKADDISVKNLLEAVSFITRTESFVALIGG